MYVAIFRDGILVVKPDLDSAFALPGNYYVFSLGPELHVNNKDGVQYYNKEKKAEPFKFNNLELINIEKVNNNFTPFGFSVYDHQSDSVKKIYAKSSNFEYALSFIVKTILTASQFPNWETYDTVTKIGEYKSEITNLKGQIKTLKSQNEELTNSLDKLQKPTS